MAFCRGLQKSSQKPRFRSRILRPKTPVFSIENIPALTRAGRAIRLALGRDDVAGVGSAEIDHIEFFGPARSSLADSRNFVLCPGGAYDRSPCGTGTSAKLACLAADQKLRPGDLWVQESVIGSRFQASYRRGVNGGVIPRIGRRAFVCSQSELHQEPAESLLLRDRRPGAAVSAVAGRVVSAWPPLRKRGALRGPRSARAATILGEGFTRRRTYRTMSATGVGLAAERSG